jgi:hypothetical protein
MDFVRRYSLSENEYNISRLRPSCEFITDTNLVQYKPPWCADNTPIRWFLITVLKFLFLVEDEYEELHF